MVNLTESNVRKRTEWLANELGEPSPLLLATVRVLGRLVRLAVRMRSNRSPISSGICVGGANTHNWLPFLLSRWHCSACERYQPFQ